MPPCAIGAALHDDFARFEPHLLRVQHQPDLAFEDAAEIESARFVHVGGAVSFLLP